MEIAKLYVALAADASQYKQQLNEVVSDSTSWAGKLADVLKGAAGVAAGALVAGLAVAGAAIAGVGAAALGLQGDIHQATNAIIIGTGASGAALESMRQSVINLAGSSHGLNTDMATIGSTMAELNTRLGLTDADLENVTGSFLDFTRLVGGDATAHVRNITRVMGDWGVETDQTTAVLDKIFGASQAFGISVDSVAQKVVQFGAPLRLMGFSLDESIALFSKWEKEGVNAELAIGSLRIAAGQFARDNIPLREGLEATIAKIQELGPGAESTALAMEIFGARAGPDMAAAILEGRFELQGAIDDLAGVEGALADAAERTIGFRERFSIALADARLALVPLAEALGKVADQLMPHFQEAIGRAVEFIRPLIEGAAAALERFFDLLNQGKTPLEAFATLVQEAGVKVREAFANIWENIVAFFQNIDWPALGRSLIERFLDAMAAAGQAKADLWSWIITTLTNFIQTTNWSEVGYRLINFLVTAILGAIGLLATAVSGIVTYIWNFITGADWIQLGRDLVAAIVKGLESFGEGASKALGEWRQKIFDWAGAEDWKGVGEKISEKVGEAAAAAGAFITAKLGEWQKKIFDWAGAEDWKGVAEKIAGDIGEKLAEADAKLVAKLGEWEQAIFAWAGAEDWRGVAEKIAGDIGEKLAEADAKLVAQLNQWQTAIFNWAGVEDWKGVAEKIAGEIGTKLGEVKETLTTRLGEWVTAIRERVANIDWYEVGYAIAYNVAEKLLAFKDLVGRKIEEWRDQMKSEASRIDWKAVGETIVEKITDFFKDIRAYLADKISSWIAQFKQETEGMAWHEVALLILEKIVLGLIDFGTKAEEAVSAWIGELQAKVTGALGRLQELGQSIVQGIANGINFARGIIGGALDALANHTVAAGEAAYGAESPARRLIPLGMDIAGGIALGITEGAGQVVDAIREVASETELAAVKAFSEAVKHIGEAITSAVQAYVLLSGFGRVSTEGAATGLASIVLLMKAMVDAFVEANEHADDVLKSAGEFLKTAETIVKLVAESLLPLRMLSRIDMSFLGSRELEKGLESIRDFLVGMVERFLEAAEELGVLGPVVKSFTEGAEAVIGLVEEGLNAATMLSRIDFGHVVQGWHLRDQIIIFRNIVRTMVREFADAALEFAYLSGAVEMFADAAEAVVGLVEDGLAAAVALSEIDFGEVVRGWHLRDQIIIFRNIIRTMVREFADAALEFGWMGDAVDSFADAAGAVVGLVEDGLSATIALSEIDFGPIVSGWHLRDQIVIFRNIIRTMVREFADAALELGSMSDTVKNFADAAGAVVGLVGDALEVIEELASFSVKGNLEANVKAFSADLVLIIQTMVNALEEAELLANEAVIQAGDMAGALGDLLGVVGDGVEAIAALSEYVSDSGIEDKARRFTADLATVILALVDGLKAAGVLANEAVIEAGEMAGTLKDLLGVVGDGVDAIAAIAEYEGVKNLEVKVKAFAEDLIVVVSTLATKLAEAAATLGTETLDAAVKFARNAQEITKAVQDAVDSLNQIAESKTPNIKPQMDYIIESVNLIAKAASETGQLTQAAASMVNFRNQIAGLVNEVLGAISELERLVSANMPGSVQDILNRIAAAFSAAQGYLTGAGAALGAALIQAFVGAPWSLIPDTIVLTVLRAIQAGQATAAGAYVVGISFVMAMVAGVNSTGQQLISAVVKLVEDAIRAGQKAAEGGAAVGRDLVAAAVGAVAASRTLLATAGSTAGTALIDGMIRAIDNDRSRLVNTIKGTMEAAVQAAKSSLGVSSPSKVFAWLARQALAGMVQIFGRPDELLHSVGSMMKRVVDTAAGAASVNPPATTGNARQPAIGQAAPVAPVIVSGGGQTFHFYGDIRVENVSDADSLLEQLAALGAGA